MHKPNGGQKLKSVHVCAADFELQSRSLNKPYDIFGTWYNNHHLLSGDLHWLAHLVSTSVLCINKATQETLSEHIPITQNMYRFYNCNASSIRAIMVADCLPHSEKAGVGAVMDEDKGKKDGGQVVEHGNPVSQWDANAVPAATSRVSGNLILFSQKKLTFELFIQVKGNGKQVLSIRCYDTLIKLCKMVTSNVLDNVFQKGQDISASCNIF